MINPDDKLHGARIRAASRLAEQRFALELRDACASTNSTILELAPPAPGVLQLLAGRAGNTARGGCRTPLLPDAARRLIVGAA